MAHTFATPARSVRKVIWFETAAAATPVVKRPASAARPASSPVGGRRRPAPSSTSNVVFGGSGPDGVKRRARPAPSSDRAGRPGARRPRAVPATSGVIVSRSSGDRCRDRSARSKMTAIGEVGAIPSIPSAGTSVATVEARRDRAECEVDRLVERDAGDVGGVVADRDLVVGVRLERLGRHDLEQRAAPAQLVRERRARGAARASTDAVSMSVEKRQRDRRRRAGRRRRRRPGSDSTSSGGPAVANSNGGGGSVIRLPARSRMPSAIVTMYSVVKRERLDRREDHACCRSSSPRPSTAGSIETAASALAALDRLAERDLDAGGDRAPAARRPAAGCGQRAPRARSAGGRRRCWRRRGRRRG